MSALPIAALNYRSGGHRPTDDTLDMRPPQQAYGARALEMVLRHLPDRSLGGELTGLDMCRALSVDAATASAPELMVLGWTSDSGIDADADGYLAELFDAAELRAWIDALVARASVGVVAG